MTAVKSLKTYYNAPCVAASQRLRGQHGGRDYRLSAQVHCIKHSHSMEFGFKTRLKFLEARPFYDHLTDDALTVLYIGLIRHL